MLKRLDELFLFNGCHTISDFRGVSGADELVASIYTHSQGLSINNVSFVDAQRNLSLTMLDLATLMTLSLMVVLFLL